MARLSHPAALVAVVLALGAGCSSAQDGTADPATSPAPATSTPLGPALDTSSPAALVAQLRRETGEWQGCNALQTDDDGVVWGNTDLASDARNGRIYGGGAPSTVIVDGDAYVILPGEIGEESSWQREDAATVLADLGELRCDLVLDALDASATAVAPHEPVPVRAVDTPAASVTVDLRTWLEALESDPGSASGAVEVVVVMDEYGLALVQTDFGERRTTQYGWGPTGPDVVAPDPENVEPSTA